MLEKIVDGAGLIPVCDCCGNVAPMDYMEGEEEIAKQDLRNIHWQINADGKRFKCTKCRGLPSSSTLRSDEHKMREMLLETITQPITAIPYLTPFIKEYKLGETVNLR